MGWWTGRRIDGEWVDGGERRREEARGGRAGADAAVPHSALRMHVVGWVWGGTWCGWYVVGLRVGSWAIVPARVTWPHCKTQTREYTQLLNTYERDRPLLLIQRCVRSLQSLRRLASSPSHGYHSKQPMLSHPSGHLLRWRAVWPRRAAVGRGLLRSVRAHPQLPLLHALERPSGRT